MKKRNIVIVGAVAIVIIIIGIIVAASYIAFPNQVVSQDEPVDIVTDFYNPWLDARQSETTDPYTAGLLEEPLLGRELRSKLKDTQNDSENIIDPVLCQERADFKIATRNLSVGEDVYQILVTSRDNTLTGQAIVTLNRIGDGWYIHDITCSPGEFGVEREFSFEKEGFLLKQSIPAPYNSENWHLVFRENEQDGHVVPLFFVAETVCVDKKGNESICISDQFLEASKVSVKAQMTEAGADVKRIEFIK